MFIARVEIKNFRGISQLVVELQEFVVLIGENNIGKTALLDAVRICLDKVPAKRGYIFRERDFTFGSKEDIVLRIVLRVKEGEPSEKVITKKLGRALNVVPDAQYKEVVLQVTGTWNELTGQASHTPQFLNPVGKPLPRAVTNDVLNGLSELSSCKALHANRTATHDFRPSAQFLAPILDSTRLDESAVESLSEGLEELSKQLVQASDGLRLVKKELENLSNVVSLDGSEDAASVSAVPASLRSLLQRTEVRLKSSSGHDLPLDYHGAGTQSLASFFLFSACTKFNRNAGECLSVACVEEPESHLHPWATVSFVETVKNIADQVIVATHSGDFVSGSNIECIRRIHESCGILVCDRVKPGTLDADEQRKFMFHVLGQRGYLLFARFWLLVEGETEYHLLPPASELLGEPLKSQGVYAVQYSQIGVGPLIKIADAFGIRWHVVTDGDSAGDAIAKKVRSVLSGRDEAKMLTQWSKDDIETVLWDDGFQSYYEGICPNPVLNDLANEQDCVIRRKKILKAALKKRSKPGAASDVFDMLQNGTECPQEIRDFVLQLSSLVKGSS